MKDEFKYHIISKDEEPSKEEFLEYFLGNSVEEAEKTYNDFSSLLNRMSYSYSSISGLEKRDIFSEALVGLARAKRDYDPKRSNDFKTFAIYNIKNAITEYVRKTTEVFSIPAYIKLANSNISAIKSILFKAEITTDDLDVSVDINKLYDINIDDSLKDKCLNHLSNLINSADRANIDLNELIKRSEFIPSSLEFVEETTQHESTEDDLIDKLMIEKLKTKMDATDRDIAQRILSGQSYTEIGEAYNKGRSWAIQRMARFGERLKELGIVK
jgi:RNA polymerase sigma factor (sigma-70 family)